MLGHELYNILSQVKASHIPSHLRNKVTIVLHANSWEASPHLLQYLRRRSRFPWDKPRIYPDRFTHSGHGNRHDA